ncbi:MAG: outer membrane lipoprotein-sorting protein [Acidobacteriia bacterium]|nr:outer membrane lipoprotein-sorting protein [Terriglobia bacterium]
MNAWRQVSLVLSAGGLSLVSVASVQAQSRVQAPPVETILTRMAQARAENRTRLRPYSVIRDYKLFGKEKQTTKAEIIADVSFVPPDVKHYAIRQANGMGLGEKIVRQMLDHETDIVKDYGSTDLTPDNYDFRFLREEQLNGQHCYVLDMLPKRKGKTLLRGQIWVDATTYQLRRTEGEPGKAPSWWLRDSRIVLVYGDVGGMWLQTASESTANVRFVGPHTMVARDVEYRFSDLAASLEMPSRGQ